MANTKSRRRNVRWQDLERLVRDVAELKFSTTARAEDIAGVKCDCVLHLNDGSVVVVEISKEQTIDKLRQDINKFNTVRPYFVHKNIFPKCFFVTLDSPTPSLIDAGKPNFVQVYSLSQFFNHMLGLHDYINLRSKLAFGSAIDLYSGQPNENDYIPVEYFSDDGDAYDPAKIADELRRGRTVVLVGAYGTGKSRCVKEVFSTLVDSEHIHHSNPIAINLRDNWGLKRAPELITRHFTDLGLGAC